MARAAQRCADAVSIAALDAARGRAWRSGPKGVADAGQLRAQLPLPETAKELCDVARNLGIPDSEIDTAIRLGERATEAQIKGLSSSGQLASYRILHFATHGALSGEIAGSKEPGLILSPPRQATDADDGYLTASEIAQLKIDADWVILSACNTAGWQQLGEPHVVGIGPRILLRRYTRDPGVALGRRLRCDCQADHRRLRQTQGRSEIEPAPKPVRLAMADLIATGTANEAHPTYWAPFVMVGEGRR